MTTSPHTRGRASAHTAPRLTKPRGKIGQKQHPWRFDRPQLGRHRNVRNAAPSCGLRATTEPGGRQAGVQHMVENNRLESSTRLLFREFRRRSRGPGSDKGGLFRVTRGLGRFVSYPASTRAVGRQVLSSPNSFPQSRSPKSPTYRFLTSSDALEDDRSCPTPQRRRREDAPVDPLQRSQQGHSAGKSQERDRPD